jgi:hypothetical protein
MSKGIVLLGADRQIEKLADGKGLNVVVDPEMGMPWDKVVFVEPGTEVPWDLLPAAWHFLERWDAAVPLWRYSVNAADVGSKAERKTTQSVIRDLRVLLHAVELLFVRNNGDGQALIHAYRQERAQGDDKRLAFLRAYYETKPRLCVLPRTWLRKIHERSKMDARATSRSRSQRPTGKRLVTVEIAPGRFVKCHPGDEEKVIAMHTGGRRHG